MATINRTVGTSYQGIEANQIFFEPFWMDQLKLGDFRVMTNVVSKKKMQFVNQLEKVVQKGGGCGFHPSGEFGMYERTIETNEFKVNLEICFDEFKDTALQEKLKKGNMKIDLSGTQIMRLILLKVRDAIQLDFQRLLWFGDKASNDPNYDITDGIWTVHIPKLVADNQTPYTDSGSGSPLGSGDAIDLLKAVCTESSNSLAGIPDQQKRFLVSRSVWNAYQDDTEGLGGGDAGRQQTINGVTTLSYRGKRLVLNANWDNYTQNDLGLVDQHQVMLTTPDNLVVATDLLSDLSSVMVFVDKLTRKTYISVEGKFGTNFVHPALFSVAY